MNGFTGGEVQTYHDDKQCIYRGTRVCEKLSRGTVTLDSGGWMTATTKKRMNQWFQHYQYPISVSQRKGKWYVAANGTEYPYRDGMTLVAFQSDVE